MTMITIHPNGYLTQLKCCKLIHTQCALVQAKFIYTLNISQNYINLDRMDPTMQPLEHLHSAKITRFYSL